MKDSDNIPTIQEDIATAEEWAKPENFPQHIVPGEGIGWRHVCYRLAQFAKKALNPHRVVTCIYCGKEYPGGTPASQDQRLTQHIKVCEKHPLRNAERRNQNLSQSLVEAKLERDRAVLEAKAIIENAKPLAVDQQAPDGYRKASEWMQRWFPN